MSDLCRMKGNLQLEPLCNQWYVSLPMLAPIPSAMMLANAQIPIMKSYVAAPEGHLALSKNPAMTGGPFVSFTFKLFAGGSNDQFTYA
ncbi:MAG: hypothetical protein JSR33_10120 [Proteobacteria bacterium]|nr:hypothetical protein [Pseudomonadota bacterium]